MGFVFQYYLDMSDDFQLEDLLDSVADAVSALVLFANEAMTDQKKLTNLQAGVSVVQSAISFFADDASRTIRLWKVFGYDSTLLLVDLSRSS